MDFAKCSALTKSHHEQTANVVSQAGIKIEDPSKINRKRVDVGDVLVNFPLNFNELKQGMKFHFVGSMMLDYAPGKIFTVNLRFVMLSGAIVDAKIRMTLNCRQDLYNIML